MKGHKKDEGESVVRYKKGLQVFLAVVLVLALAGCGAAGASGSGESGAPAQDAAPAIAVQYLEGEAVYLRNSEEFVLSTDTLLHQGDAIITQGDGLVVLKLDDDKQVQIAPGSHVEIAGFVRGAGGDKTLLTLHGGSIINVLDALLEGDDSYAVQTPSLVMAIRGTIASVSCEADSGQSRVLLFEGSGMVDTISGSAEAEITAGGYAWTRDGLLEHRAFAQADLNGNEHWFLYEVEYATYFGQAGAQIPNRLAPMLDGLPTADASTPQDDTSAAGQAASAGGAAPAGGGGEMDEETFRAIEQEFLQAKEAYNNGRMSRNDFLAIKQRYIEAKRLYYGE